MESEAVLLLSARTTMWSMPGVLTETENENDSANQNDVVKMTSPCRMETAVVLCTNILILEKNINLLLNCMYTTCC